MKPCAAGRTAFFGGRWARGYPCPNDGRHIVAAEVGPPIPLCDRHFEQVLAAGLVSEPYINPDEFERRRPDLR